MPDSLNTLNILNKEWHILGDLNINLCDNCTLLAENNKDIAKGTNKISSGAKKMFRMGSFKRYVTPEGGGRVVNFVTNRYGNQRGGEGVSVMPLRKVDKFFYMANFTRNLSIGSYSLYYLTSKTLVFR